MSASKLGQYFNQAGIRTFLSTLLWNRRNFTPHIRARSVAHINYAKLASCGIKYLVFDKDNTLTEPYTMQYENYAFLQDCQKAFPKAHMAILSNSAGSKDDPDGTEAAQVEKSLGLKVIKHVNKKPAVCGDILGHFQTEQKHEIAVVGDRILSDVVMGNSHGMFTIYVEPICTKRENFVVRLVRLFEDKVLPFMTPSDGQPPVHETISQQMLHELVLHEPANQKVYKVPNLAVDCIVTKQRQSDGGIDILLITRGSEPFEHCHAFPGGFVRYGESPRVACLRELEEECSVKGVDPELITVAGEPERDPRKHVVSIAYAVEVDPSAEVKAASDAATAKWHDLETVWDSFDLAFDHRDILKEFLEKKHPEVLNSNRRSD